MNKLILLDAGPLGMISHPRADRNRDILEWVVLMLEKCYCIKVPEITDYEVFDEDI